MHAALSIILLLAIPSLWSLSGWWGVDKQQTSVDARAHRWTLYSTQVLLVSLLFLGGWLAYHTLQQASGQWIRLNPLSLIVSCLIVFIGSLLLRFSKQYLAGDAAYPAFYRWMLLTLSAVAITVTANHLLLFWCGWITISLCLHRLLLLYPERRRAQIAARKKFILARLAEICLLLSFVLLYQTYGTLFIDELLTVISNAYAQQTPLPAGAQAAALLLAVTALIKCAQLPLHGWLIGVIESPTPTSALLHAGIINLGGYLLILFSPLVMQSALAQWTLMLVAGSSVLLAALVMACKTSVKERLAWSTCAQMGLMLVECALGLYALALMHLVLHSLYKAYAFLNAGNAVNERQLSRLCVLPSAAWQRQLAMAVVIGLLISGLYWLSDSQGAVSPWCLLAVALFYYLRQANIREGAQALFAIASVAVAILMYILIKRVMESYFLSYPHQEVGQFQPLDVAFMLIIGTLVTLVEVRQHCSHSRYMQHVNAWLFAGGYLDEYLSRYLLRCWPIKMPKGGE